MIDLDDIENEVGTGNNDEALMFTRGEMLELITRLRQSENDAARYRWLRDVADDFDINDFFMCSQVGEKRDAFADEAMNGSNN